MSITERLLGRIRPLAENAGKAVYHLPTSYKGIELIQHGTPMVEHEATHFMSTLSGLVEDFPSVGEKLSTIHIFDRPKKIANEVHAKIFQEMTKEQLMGVATAGEPYGRVIGINRNLFESNEMKNWMVAQHPGKTALRENPASRILEHEFGHQVHFRVAEAMPASREGMIKKLFDYNYEEGIDGPRQLMSEFRDMVEDMSDVQVNALRTDFAHEDVFNPLYEKHFPELLQRPSGDVLGSHYAATNMNEAFAEVFARARLGEGPGARESQNIISDVQRILASATFHSDLFSPELSAAKIGYLSNQRSVPSMLGAKINYAGRKTVNQLSGKKKLDERQTTDQMLGRRRISSARVSNMRYQQSRMR
jgi:hypothetical protein